MQLEQLAGAQPAGEAEQLGEVAERGAGRGRAGRLARPRGRRRRVGRTRPQAIFTSVDLPAPFGPEQPDQLARLDLQVDPGQRLGRPVALGEPLAVEGGGHAAQCRKRGRSLRCGLGPPARAPPRRVEPLRLSALDAPHDVEPQAALVDRGTVAARSRRSRDRGCGRGRRSCRDPLRRTCGRGPSRRSGGRCPGRPGACRHRRYRRADPRRRRPPAGRPGPDRAPGRRPGRRRRRPCRRRPLILSRPRRPSITSPPPLPPSRSFPLPPSITSLPPAPFTTSLPPRPQMTSLPRVPLIRSLPGVPTIVQRSSATSEPPGPDPASLESEIRSTSDRNSLSESVRCVNVTPGPPGPGVSPPGRCCAAPRCRSGSPRCPRCRAPPRWSPSSSAAPGGSCDPRRARRRRPGSPRWRSRVSTAVISSLPSETGVPLPVVDEHRLDRGARSEVRDAVVDEAPVEAEHALPGVRLRHEGGRGPGARALEQLQQVDEHGRARHEAPELASSRRLVRVLLRAQRRAACRSALRERARPALRAGVERAPVRGPGRSRPEPRRRRRARVRRAPTRGPGSATLDAASLQTSSSVDPSFSLRVAEGWLVVPIHGRSHARSGRMAYGLDGRPSRTA